MSTLILMILSGLTLGIIRVYIEAMIQSINAPISVILTYDSRTNRASPAKIIWQNQPYYVNHIGYHHTFHQGKILYHVYSLTANNTFFRLELNTQNLHWRVTEVADAEVN